jgi:hypothetical protein
MSPVHRAARPALLAAGALLLCACGIPTTGVVGSGEPATGIRSTTTVYFMRKGGLVAVPRRTPQRADVEAAVKVLFQGPSTSDERAGVTSRLPRLRKDPTVRTDGAEVSIALGFDSRQEFGAALKSLSATALDQLVCTVVSARHAEDPDVESVEVAVTATMGGAENHWRTEGNSATCAKSIRTQADPPRPA